MVAANQFNFDELDEATKHYLRTVWKHEGRGMPGVYERLSDWLPCIGLFVGLGLIAATLLFTWAPLDYPLQTTFLQTAGVLTGGWMIVAACRTWLGRSAGNVGHFVYADPARLWSVSGGRLEVISLQGLAGVEARDTYNNEGAYQNTNIQVFVPEGVRSIQVASTPAAERIVAYLQVLAVLPSQGPEWENLTLAERGHRAREMAGELTDRYSEDLSVAIPSGPRRVGGGAGWLLLALLLTGLVGIALFWGLYELNLVTRDHAIFDLVKNSDPTELRMYLIDKRTTRHRDEVIDILRRKYQVPIATIKKEANDPNLGAALATLVETISTAPLDILTLRLTNDGGNVGDLQGEVVNPIALQKEMAKQLTEAIGGKLIQVYGVPDKVDPMLEWSFRWVPVNDKYTMKWTAVFRTGPDNEPFQKVEGDGPEAVELQNVPAATHAEMQRFLRNLVGDRVVPKAPPNQFPWN